MADHTPIEWTDATWNPITGCSVVSPGCTNCYAMRLAGTRLRNHQSRIGLTRDTKAGPVWTGIVNLNAEWLDQPLRWSRPRRIFVCAHGDLFHESVPDDWIEGIFGIMAAAPQHTFQVLTKRAERMREWVSKTTLDRCQAELCSGSWPESKLLLRRTDFINGPWPLPNVWLGVSVEDQPRADERIPRLLATPAARRFISAEPLLGPVDLLWALGRKIDVAAGLLRHGHFSPGLESLRRLDWVIAGGESGHGARPMHPHWVRSLRDQCIGAGVPFFFKQWGEWAPICSMTSDEVDACYAPAPDRNPEATRRCKVETCVMQANGDRLAVSSPLAFRAGMRSMTMMAIGKSKAGAQLDGREWREMPHG